METIVLDQSLLRLTKLSKRAFIARFPVMPDGVSNKYAAMDLFLNNDEYANSLVPDQTARIALRLKITMGSLFLSESKHVDYEMTDASRFTLLLTQADIPTTFRLTTVERDAILNVPISAGEQP